MSNYYLDELPHTVIVMLGWFVDVDILSAVLKNPKKLIEEEDVEIRPENITIAAIDENIDVHLIRRYFSNEAWLQVMGTIEQKRNNPVYVCKSCSHNLDESESVCCDHCLVWFHTQCVGLKRSPKSHYWFCRGCHESPLS